MRSNAAHATEPGEDKAGAVELVCIPKGPRVRQHQHYIPPSVPGFGSSAQQRQDVESRRAIWHWAWPTAIGSMNGGAQTRIGVGSRRMGSTGHKDQVAIYRMGMRWVSGNRTAAS